jgi:hypothetical protein
LTDDPVYKRCLEEDESTIHVLCDCPFTVSSPGPVLHGTRWLLWRPHKSGPAVRSKCGIDKEVNKRGSTIDQRWSRCRGQMRSAPHIYIYILDSCLRIRCRRTVFTSRCLAMNVYSDFNIPVFVHMSQYYNTSNIMWAKVFFLSNKITRFHGNTLRDEIENKLFIS